MDQVSTEDKARSIVARYRRVSGDRGSWESHWEEIASRVWPEYSGSFTNGGIVSQGARKTQEMVDATAALALPKFAAAMDSMLTPHSSIWHRMQAQDSVLKRNRATKMWFDDVNAVLFRRRYAPRANFANQVFTGWLSLGAFGTSALHVDALDKRDGGGLRYKQLHLGGVYFLENHQGIIDTLLRKFDLTARQAYQRFGEELPDDIALAAKDPAKCEQKFWFIHCVQPRGEEDGYDPDRLDVKGMKFAAYYVSEAKPKIVKEGGHNTFPVPISRYVQAPGETYGRSPAMLALPSIKTLNEQKKTVLKQGHRVVDPVLLAADDGVVDGFNLRPGAINGGAVSAEGRPLVHALPSGDLAIAQEMMQDEAAVIKDAFLVTLFQILVEAPQMTATEVLQRVQEKGVLLSPMMGRQQSEFLGPLVDRELDVLAEQRMLPPPPPILRQARAEFELIYDSPLSRSQRAEQGAGFMRLVDFAREYVGVTQDVTPLDWLNWDEAMPAMADINAAPAAWINDAEAVAAKRAGRAQQAQMQQMVDAAPAVSGIVKAMPQGGK